MKKSILLIVLFTFLLAEDKSESYKIEGMHCGYGCVNKVKSMMDSLDGMKMCEVSFEKSLMTVEYDDSKVNSDMILKLLADNTTYKTVLINNQKKEKKTFWSKVKGIFKG
tara:strand:- start:20 stop:349 length:330 start_codon:yes stop_codon:yes gene_type:complete